MGSTILPGKQRRQPQRAPRIDWSNPLTLGLVDVIDLSGEIPRSLVLGTPATPFGTKPFLGVTEQGKVSDASAAFGGWYFQRSDGAYANGKQSHVCVGQYNTISGTYAGFFAVSDGAGANNSFSLQAGSTSLAYVYLNNSVKATLTNGLIPVLDSKPHVVVLTHNGAKLNMYSDGANVPGGTDISTISPTAFSTSRLILFGERSASASYSVKGKKALHLVYNRQLSRPEVQALSANPWQVFKKDDFIPGLVGAGGGAINLAANAAGSATAIGALTQSVPLAAAGISQATATGAVSHGIPIAGAATAIANAGGGLSLSIPLSASAIAAAIGAGNLSLNVSLDGAALAAAAAAADLGVISSGLSGAAAASALAAGALSLDLPLTASALTIANAAGTLTQIVPLDGSAASASVATGGLDISVGLSGSALASALAAAGLDVSGGMSGNATANAVADGTLTLRINLAGSGLATAIAAGLLTASGLITAATPGYVVARALQNYRVTRAARSWRITA